MREIRAIGEMRLFSERARFRGKKVGLVPTMGALHEGHLSLVAEARKRSDVAVVSIFVNPLQFGPREDFKAYPRDLRKDRRLLKNFDVDAVFIPEAAEMFPKDFKTYVEVKELSDKLCGGSRPGHFQGVATVVAKLFNIVCPDLAFFGEKDYQQQLLIRRMARELDLPVEIVALPTVREFDGLAMSSRNTYLSPEERSAATALYRALCLAKTRIRAGERDAGKLRSHITALLLNEPKVRIDYISVADPEDLTEIKRIKGKVLVALAAYVGKTRLIDNMVIKA
jgi:pantoate--beta-alanine ligase